MVCPKCGEPIPEGKLYCEYCGEEIMMVPDFEPEIEYSMTETLSGIGEGVLEQIPGQAPKKKKSKVLIIIILVVCMILGIVAFFSIMWYHRYNSVPYQLKQAETCFNEGDITKASEYYERAVELNPEDMSVRLVLADLYRQIPKKEEEFLEEINYVIFSGKASDDDLLTAYKIFIAYYQASDNYDAINQLIQKSNNDEIKNQYRKYLAMPPAFSYMGGNYAEILALKITSDTEGRIYYTLDGSMPDENSELYTSPIFLDTGNYTVCAIFINGYGIKSEVVSANYDIDVIKPIAPEVVTYSGDYTTPQLIAVVEPLEGIVYYTTDGSLPTENSNMYLSPIPMPIGISRYTFAVITESGISSEPTVVEYNLTLTTEFTPEAAISQLLNVLVEKGKLRDTFGTPEEIEGRYLYQYQSVIDIPEAGHFYVIAETYEDLSGVQSKSGTIYAVNIYDGTCYKLSRGALDEYILEPFQ